MLGIVGSTLFFLIKISFVQKEIAEFVNNEGDLTKFYSLLATITLSSLALPFVFKLD
jgi:hypothetical protein